MPVGVPLPGATGETVAVKVTGWPTVLGFCEEVTAVVVLAGLTTCGAAPPKLPWKLESPA